MRVGRTETWVDDKFKTSINLKDGHVISDCIDLREKRVLEFVILILYPEKLNMVTKEVGNTVFDAMSGEYKVSWRQVIHKVVDKLVFVLGKGNLPWSALTCSTSTANLSVLGRKRCSS